MVAFSGSEGARAPVFASRAARLGVVVVVGFSIAIGAVYWWERDPMLAVLTLGAELIAFAGLATAYHQFRNGAIGLGLGAVVVTLIFAAWCGFTMFQKIEADTRAEQIERAQELPRYVFASNAAETAQRILRERLEAPNPRPTCNCPQTVAAWEAAEAASIERLRAERDAAVREMQAAIPPPQTDWIAIARGLGVEIGKLFGLMVFGLAVSRPPTMARPRQPFEVVEGGRTTDQPTSRPASGQPVRPRRKWGLLAGIAAWLALIGQQPAPAAADQPAPLPTNQPTNSAKPPLELVVSADQDGDVPTTARALAAAKWSERKIARELDVTRYQVRVWLGRERKAA